MTKKRRKYSFSGTTEEQAPHPQKPIHQPISISFRSIREGGKGCLSHCQKNDIKAYLGALRLLSTMSWLEVMKTGGKPGGGKVGLGYCQYPDMKLEGVSKDLRISGLRAGSKARVYGYKLDNIFYIVEFDPNHSKAK